MSSVAVYGPSHAGKLTLANAFAKVRDARMETFEIPIPGMPHVSDRGVRFVFDDGKRRDELDTLSGGVFNDDAWLTVVGRARALAVMVETRSTESDVRNILAKLPRSYLPSLGCIILSKQDLVDGTSLATSSVKILETLELHAWRVFKTRLDRPQEHLAPLEWLFSHIAPTT
jgi:hypothetical protein